MSSARSGDNPTDVTEKLGQEEKRAQSSAPQQMDVEGGEAPHDSGPVEGEEPTTEMHMVTQQQAVTPEWANRDEPGRGGGGG